MHLDELAIGEVELAEFGTLPGTVEIFIRTPYYALSETLMDHNKIKLPELSSFCREMKHHLGLLYLC